MGRGRERHINQLALARAPAEDQTCNPGVCLTRNPTLTFHLWGDTQPTEPRPSGQPHFS